MTASGWLGLRWTPRLVAVEEGEEPPLGAPVVAHVVHGDPVEPRADVGVRPEGVAALPRGHEHLLDHILGGGAGSGEAVRDAAQPGGVGVEELAHVDDRLNQGDERASLLEARINSFQDELTHVREGLEQEHENLASYLGGLRDLEADIRKRKIVALEKEIRDIRGRAFDTSQE